MRADQRTQASHLVCGSGLADYEQVETRVVQRCEQILDRAGVAQLELNPREAVSRSRSIVGQAGQGLPVLKWGQCNFFAVFALNYVRQL